MFIIWSICSYTAPAIKWEKCLRPLLLLSRCYCGSNSEVNAHMQFPLMEPPGLASVCLMLCDITACDELSHTFLFIYACKWTVKLQPRPGQSFSILSVYLSRGERCKKILVPSLHGRKISLLQVIQRWQKRLLVKWCAFLQMKICPLHWERAYFWACENFYCHTKLLSFSTWPLERHMHNPTKKIVLCSQLSFDSEDVKLWTQTIGVHGSIICRAKHYNQESSWFAKQCMA